MKKTRILIADDHSIVRKGLSVLIGDQEDMEVAGETGNGLECCRMVQALKPDVVLMDITMPGLDGIESTKRIKEADPGVKILGLTMHEDERYFFRMLQAGASGCVVKGAAPEELFAGLRTVARGEIYLCPAVAKKLLHNLLGKATATDAGYTKGLSERENEVLKLIAEGRTSAEIAETLCIAVNTVERHRSNIMDKLNLHNRAELIRYAVRVGLVEA